MLTDLHKSTLLVFDRISLVSGFHVGTMQRFISSTKIPARVKHIRYQNLCEESYLGRSNKTDIYYHHTLINSDGWVLLEDEGAEEKFRQSLTPQLLPTNLFDWEKIKEAERIGSPGWLERIPELLLKLANFFSFSET